MLSRIPVANHVAYSVPPSYERVVELSHNLWWSWHDSGRSLWAALDPDRWERTHNALDVVRSIEPHRWRELEQIETIQERYRHATAGFDAYMSAADTWYEHQGSPLRGPVAYLCTEYGVHSSLPFYSGGLGILAGDHVKSASDLGLPFVAVGILFRRGYFRQQIDPNGDQQHIYPIITTRHIPVRPVASPTGGQLTVAVEMPDREVVAAVWMLAVGRVPLLLLDTDVVENHPADRPITHQLYVRGREMRLCQELVLGIGGVRALKALGIEPAVWHINEGHAALSVLERMAVLAQDGTTADAAREQIRRHTVFTLHTPVPAGNERFERSLADRYLQPWAQRLGMDADGIAGLAVANGDTSHVDHGALAIRFASVVNGVSRRHGEIVTRDWSELIGGEAAAVTNGVHPPTWVSREADRFLRGRLGPSWASALLEDPALVERVAEVPAADIWRAHLERKEVLARFARGRLRRQAARHGASPDDLRAIESFLPPDRLTLGFARRFAAYKRATLMFRDVGRLAGILTHGERPIQLIFAGKAHPADDHGQAFIRHLVELSTRSDLAGHLYVLEDFDARMARFLVQGCDVWVNNPRPPMEASGTSGMKAAMNGGLNLSVRDGWWAEGDEGDNGWSFGWSDGADDHEAADAHDADDFYRLLAEEVAPAYYERGGDGIPAEWVRRMRRAVASTLVRFSSHRMVADYFDLAYRPMGS